jgi:uncharacterized damage-inducible protein DinB
MGRIAIDTLLSILEDAFEGDTDQSLLANLRDVRDDDWLAAPPDGRRSIADILEHVGWAKWMDEDYAFGPATLRGDVPPMVTADLRPRPKDELLAWLREGHHCLTASVAALADDRELDRLRLTNWGEWLPTRTLVHILIGHDFYHAGEINHIRALLQRDDGWPY